MKRPFRGGVDALVLDLYLPAPEDGLALAKRYAAVLPAVVVTGRARAAEAGTAMEYGAVKILEKPVQVADLVRVAGNAALRHRFRSLARGVPFLVDSIECLFTRAPSTVTQWALAMGPGLNYLERRWEEKGWTPREVLRMFHLCRGVVAGLCGAGTPPGFPLLLRYYTRHEERLRGFFGPSASPLIAG